MERIKMSYSKEFIKDKILIHELYHQWENVINVIYARWKITNSEYPSGFSYYYFEKELDINVMERDTYIAIDDVTDAQLEAWCVADLTPNTISVIQSDGLAEIRKSHWLSTLTTHYENPEQ
jgi:hypothetical protein